MPAATSIPVQRNQDLLIPFISVLLIVLYFFYIDEGFYDFRWMADMGNWVAFGMYIAIFFGIQWLIYHFVLGFLKSPLRQTLMLGVITPGVVMLILWLVF